jgi:LysR family transcriptional regulator, regulator for genes of the gallate degradation pathway
MLRELISGTADVLIGALRTPLPDTDIVQEHLFDDPLALVVRVDHPLAGLKTQRIRDLARYPWIAPRANSPLHQQFNELLTHIGQLRHQPSIECNSVIAARRLLTTSDHIMLLSPNQIRHELETGTLATLVHPLGRVTRPIGFTMRENWQPTKVQRALIDTLRFSACRQAA